MVYGMTILLPSYQPNYYYYKYFLIKLIKLANFIVEQLFLTTIKIIFSPHLKFLSNSQSAATTHHSRWENNFDCVKKNYLI